MAFDPAAPRDPRAFVRGTAEYDARLVWLEGRAVAGREEERRELARCRGRLAVARHERKGLRLTAEQVLLLDRHLSSLGWT